MHILKTKYFSLFCFPVLFLFLFLSICYLFFWDGFQIFSCHFLLAARITGMSHYVQIYIYIYLQDLCLRASSSTQHRGWIGHAAEGSEGRQSKLYPQQAIEENSRGFRLFQGSWGLPAESQLLGSSCREPASVKEAGVTHFRHFSSIVRWVHQTAKPPPTPLPNLHSLH